MTQARGAAVPQRSWSRLGRPCQNSTSSTPSRQPPQNGGRGTSRPRSAPRPRRRAVELGAAGEHLALRRRPRPDLAVAGREAKYSSLSAADALDRAAHADLAVQVEPGEDAGGPRVGDELAALGAVVVGVEHEAAVVDAAHEHEPGVGHAVGVGGRHDHCVGLGAPRPSWRPRTSDATARTGRRRRRRRRARPSRTGRAGANSSCAPRGRSGPRPSGSVMALRSTVGRACTACSTVGDGDRAVGLAEVLDDRRPHPRHGERRAVQRVGDLGALRRPALDRLRRKRMLARRAW